MLKLGVLALVLAMSSAASAVVVDDFTDGGISLTAIDLIGQTESQVGLDPNTVLGGGRDIYVGATAGATVGTQLVIDDVAGELSLTSDPVQRGYMTLEYIVADAQGLDLTAEAGNDRISLDVVNVTQGISSGVFDLKIESGPLGNTVSESTSFGPGRLWDLPGSGVVDVPYADFTSTDFTQVRAISIDIARFPADANLTLGGIATTPEPASIMALLVLTALARRRR